MLSCAMKFNLSMLFSYPLFFLQLFPFIQTKVHVLIVFLRQYHMPTDMFFHGLVEAWKQHFTKFEKRIYAIWRHETSLLL